MDERKLIEFVSQNCFLYDVNHVKYGDAAHKEQVWKKIGEDLKVSGHACKTRWNNIRDNYRKSLKKRFTSTAQPWKRRPRYKYETLLGFIHPYFQKPDTVDANTTAFNDDEEDGEENAANNCEIADEMLVDTLGAITQDDSYMESKESLFKLKNQQRKESSSGVNDDVVIEHIDMQPETAVGSLMKYILQKNELKRASPREESVDAFLASLAPTLKALTPYLLNQAKSKMFAVVQKYELAMIDKKRKQSSGKGSKKKRKCSVEVSSEDSSVDLSRSPSPAHI